MPSSSGHLGKSTEHYRLSTPDESLKIATKPAAIVAGRVQNLPAMSGRGWFKMQVVKDCSDFFYGKGTNPHGGGSVVLKPETDEEKADVIAAGGWERSPEWSPGEYRFETRLVQHDPNPHGGGKNRCLIELARKYGLKFKDF